MVLGGREPDGVPRPRGLGAGERSRERDPGQRLDRLAPFPEQVLDDELLGRAIDEHQGRRRRVGRARPDLHDRTHRVAAAARPRQAIRDHQQPLESVGARLQALVRVAFRRKESRAVERLSGLRGDRLHERELPGLERPRSLEGERQSPDGGAADDERQAHQRMVLQRWHGSERGEPAIALLDRSQHDRASRPHRLGQRKGLVDREAPERVDVVLLVAERLAELDPSLVAADGEDGPGRGERPRPLLHDGPPHVRGGDRRRERRGQLLQHSRQPGRPALQVDEPQVVDDERAALTDLLDQSDVAVRVRRAPGRASHREASDRALAGDQGHDDARAGACSRGEVHPVLLRRYPPDPIGIVSVVSLGAAGADHGGDALLVGRIGLGRGEDRALVFLAARVHDGDAGDRAVVPQQMHDRPVGERRDQDACDLAERAILSHGRCHRVADPHEQRGPLTLEPLALPDRLEPAHELRDDEHHGRESDDAPELGLGPEAQAFWRNDVPVQREHRDEHGDSAGDPAADEGCGDDDQEPGKPLERGPDRSDEQQGGDARDDRDEDPEGRPPPRLPTDPQPREEIATGHRPRVATRERLVDGRDRPVLCPPFP
jgi:hypothetical protein